MLPPTHPGAVFNSFPVFSLHEGWERAGWWSEMKWNQAETMHCNKRRRNENKMLQCLTFAHGCVEQAQIAALVFLYKSKRVCHSLAYHWPKGWAHPKQVTCLSQG